MKSSQLGAVCRVSTVHKLSLDHGAVSSLSAPGCWTGNAGPDSSPTFSSADHGEISKEIMVLCQRPGLLILPHAGKIYKHMCRLQH